MAGPGRTPRRRTVDPADQLKPLPYQPTPSDVFLAASTGSVHAGVFGRLGRDQQHVTRHMLNPPATGLAAGNSYVTSDARGLANAARPGSGMGGTSFRDTGPGNESPYGSVSGVQVRQVRSRRELLTSRYSYTDAFQHGQGIARDRHLIENQGKSASSNREQATGGNPNPQKDGPPRPAWKMLNRTFSKTYGNDTTRGLDNGQFHAKTTVMGSDRIFPLGEQGTEWVRRYGGTPFLTEHRPYGKRGGYDGGPQPRVKADPGGPYRFNTLLAQGDPGDGPQKIYGGLPWGLHTPTVPPVQVTKGVINQRFGQVKPVWNVRPSNSKTAGQSWSQSMVTLSGAQAVKLETVAPIRQPGLNARWLGQ